jgi:hypothetical protein
MYSRLLMVLLFTGLGSIASRADPIAGSSAVESWAQFGPWALVLGAVILYIVRPLLPKRDEWLEAVREMTKQSNQQHIEWLNTLRDLHHHMDIRQTEVTEALKATAIANQAVAAALRELGMRRRRYDADGDGDTA